MQRPSLQLASPPWHPVAAGLGGRGVKGRRGDAGVVPVGTVLSGRVVAERAVLGSGCGGSSGDR